MKKTVVVYKGKTKGKNKIIKRAREHKYDFLKNWRVVRYWAKRKYDITDIDLEILLYLYDIELFTRKSFREFEGLLRWDKTRFDDLLKKGYLVEWREKPNPRQARLYTLSIMAKRICATVYKKLVQEEHIPENHVNNPIFKGNNYMDRMYRKAIKKMNKERELKLQQEKEKELGIIK